MLASLCCLFTQIDISLFFICHAILDCILDILNIMLGFSGSCLTLWRLWLSFFVLAGNWTDVFQIASSDKPYGNYGPNVTSSINSFAILFVFVLCVWASLTAQMVKNMPAMQETWVWSLGWEDPLEKGMATPSSILAWRIPRTEEPGGLQLMGSQRVRQEWVTNTFISPVCATLWPFLLLGSDLSCSSVLKVNGTLFSVKALHGHTGSTKSTITD